MRILFVLLVSQASAIKQLTLEEDKFSQKMDGSIWSTLIDQEEDKGRIAEAKCKCGGPFSTNRIVGGTVITAHTIPFQVGLATRSGVTPFCGGSLISPNYVLTAAHCTSETTPSAIRVFVGDHNWQILGDGEQFLNVDSILVHPNYSAANLWSNDFSLLKLVSPVTVPSTTTGLVCLPPDVNQTFAGEQLITSGWGFIQRNSSLSPTLKAAGLLGLSNQECQAIFGPLIGPSHICASGIQNNSTCQGDSGGPLTAVVNARVTLVGVTSFGATGCPTTYPPAFARVTAQKNWILANSNAGSYQCDTTEDGSWGPWSGFSCCSTTCGRGLQIRSRECNNPAPGAGGKSCDGQSNEIQFCNEANPCTEGLKLYRRS